MSVLTVGIELMEHALLSVSFDKNGKLLTGLLLDGVRLRPGFFSRGRTIAVFQLSANCPLFLEMLTMAVMVLPTLLWIFLSNFVGMGSLSHDLVGMFIRIFMTSSSLIDLKESRDVQSMGVGM